VSGGGTGLPDPRTPVLVGMGTCAEEAPAPELMARAVEAAGQDAGATALLGAVDLIAVPQGSWAYADPARLVAGRIGAPGARTHLVELGIPQQTVINLALEALSAGRSDVAVVVGGEARRWERDQGGDRTGVGLPETTGAPADVVHRRTGPLMEPVEVAHRLWEPVQQYAMIDNALRVSEHRTVAEHRAEVAALWEGFNRVARDNPDAAFPAPMEADQIATPSVGNRPLAFPYNKWHASQWTVNQAAALLLCTAEAASRFGIPRDRWVFPLVGLTSSHSVSLLRRRRPQAWPAMGVLGRTAAARVGRSVADADVVEVYSCFPAAVRVQQRELGLDRMVAPTVTGGMAFAGGPFNNFVYQAMAPVVAQLRSAPGTLGAVTTVSGLLTKPGIGMWSGRPDGQPPLIADLATRAAAQTAVVEPGAVVKTLDGFRGNATVVTYTVTYEGMDPVRSVVLCDTDDGRRCVAISEDPELAGQAVTHELVGARVRIDKGSFRPL
jgi:acetyl-CoA C-acetyltransferase